MSKRSLGVEPMTVLDVESGIAPDVVQVVGSCMLARELHIQYGLGSAESVVVQELILHGQQGVDALAEAVGPNSPTSPKRTVERVVGRLRKRGLIDTNKEWRTATYELHPEVLETTALGLAERIRKAHEAKAVLDEWAYDWMVELITFANQDSEANLSIIDTLRSNVGWPIPASMLDAGANNLTRTLKSLSTLLPPGLIKKIGTNNMTHYMFDLDVVADLAQPQEPEESVETSIDISHLDDMRVGIGIRSERALQIVALLQKSGGELHRKDLIARLRLDDPTLNKEKLYRAMKVLDENGIIAPADEEKPKNIVTLSETFDHESYFDKAAAKREHLATRNRRRRPLTPDEREDRAGRAAERAQLRESARQSRKVQHAVAKAERAKGQRIAEEQKAAERATNQTVKEKPIAKERPDTTAPTEPAITPSVHTPKIDPRYPYMRHRVHLETTYSVPTSLPASFAANLFDAVQESEGLSLPDLIAFAKDSGLEPEVVISEVQRLTECNGTSIFKIKDRKVIPSRFSLSTRRKFDFVQS